MRTWLTSSWNSHVLRNHSTLSQRRKCNENGTDQTKSAGALLSGYRMLTQAPAVVLCSGFIGALPQLDRGTDYESVRQGFESLMPHHEKRRPETYVPGLFFCMCVSCALGEVPHLYNTHTCQNPAYRTKSVSDFGRHRRWRPSFSGKSSGNPTFPPGQNVCPVSLERPVQTP